jgi:hypothetical protein
MSKTDHLHSALNEVGGEFREPFQLILRVAMFQGEISALYISHLAQALAQWRFKLRQRSGGTRLQYSNRANCRLLRPRHHRQRRHAEPRDELPPLH